MGESVPARLELDRHWLIVLERLFLAAEPEEGCALLLGRRSGAALIVGMVWPCCNVWESGHWDSAGLACSDISSRRNRFAVDPRESLLAQQWGRRQKLQVLGAAHSHPKGAAVPSQLDLDLTLGPALMLIRSGLQQEDLRLRAWWIQGSDSAPAPLILEGFGDLGE